jgi:hypothetical protein
MTAGGASVTAMRLSAAGHAFLLGQCVRESPGFRLVEANAYLPR